MEKIIEFSPAYDRRDTLSGIHGAEIRFVLKGDKGAVQFLLCTNWYLPHVQKEIDSRYLDSNFPYRHHNPIPADLGYHSPVPRYEGQTKISDSCPYLDGKPCYYDGSSLAADRVFTRLLEEGDKGVWKELEDCYQATFGFSDDDKQSKEL